MKKLKYYLILGFVFLTTIAIYSQNPVAKGQSQLNLGVGLSNYGLPLYIGFDYGVHRDITLGLEFSYRNYNERFQDNRYDHSILGFSGNANYHFNSILNIPSNWDFYAGLNIGFYHWRSARNYPGNFNSGIGIGGQVGGRYYFTNKFGVNLEFGGGNAFSGGKFGISLLF